MAERHGLIVAGSKYQDPALRPLRASVQEADALARVLADPAIGGFNLSSIVNQPSHVVYEAIDDLFTDLSQDDLVLLYVIGHAVRDEEGNLYFATADTRLRQLAATAVAAEFINRCMTRSRSSRVVLLLDCSFGGAFTRGMSPRTIDRVNVADQFTGQGRAIMANSTTLDYAFEGDELSVNAEVPQSGFTSAIVAGLETGEADLDGDGSISLDELYDYVFDRIREATARRTPWKWVFAVRGELVIAWSARPSVAALPAELQLAITQPLPDVRLGAVEALTRLLTDTHAGLAFAARRVLEDLVEDDSRRVSAAADEALKSLPRLQVSATEIDFGRLTVGSESPSRTIRLVNVGGGVLNPRVITGEQWMRVEQADGKVTVVADTSTVGTFAGDITVHSEGGSAMIRVVAHIDPKPVLAVEPSAVDFGRLTVGELPALRRVVVRNLGGGELEWRVYREGNFFEVEREGDAITVRLLSIPGRHAGAILLRSNGGDELLDVLAEVVAASTRPAIDRDQMHLLLTTYQYDDFRLRIEREQAGAFRIIASGEKGEASASAGRLVSDVDLANFILKVGRTRHGVRRLESKEMQLARRVGGQLFDALFQGSIRDVYRNCRQAAEDRGKGLRVKLHLAGVPELMHLPWEYLYDDPEFLSISAWTPVVRYLDLPRAPRSLAVKPPLRILGMVSSPADDDVEALDVDEEATKLEQALQHLIQDGMVRIHWLDRASLSDLRRALQREWFHVFHYIGHGGYDVVAEDGSLLLEDERGRARPVSGAKLGTMLADHRTLRLAVLNACEGARSSIADPFAGVAASLVQRNIPAVIAMQFEITDRAAIVFCEEFYTALSGGFPVDAALAEARKAIFADDNDIEWGTPVLFMRVADGRLFEIVGGDPARG